MIITIAIIITKIIMKMIIVIINIISYYYYHNNNDNNNRLLIKSNIPTLFSLQNSLFFYDLSNLIMNTNHLKSKGHIIQFKYNEEPSKSSNNINVTIEHIEAEQSYLRKDN